MTDIGVTRWGILGTGGIAATFAADLQLLPDAEIVAVGSRSQASANRFAHTHSIPHRHASYAALVADKAVDAVYVATPHTAHHACSLLAIDAGKAVLVEKPFTVNAAEAKELIAAARSRGTFLMEAMWTRFLPHIVRIRELIADGRLGAVRSLQADFGERVAPNPTHRAFAPDLGGGALLDLGVYPVSLSSMLFGRPSEVVALSQSAFTGVDAQTGLVLKHPGGELAVLLTTMETRTGNRASINGTIARIEVAGDFLAPSSFCLIDNEGASESFDFPHEGRGLRHQVAEVGRCLRQSLTESPVMPLDESLTITQTLDEIRLQIGLRYPAERGN